VTFPVSNRAQQIKEKPASGGKLDASAHHEAGGAVRDAET